MRLPLLELPPLAPPVPASGPRSIAAVKVLRVSLTDRCNYRCVYCMPSEGVPWLDKTSLLTADELIRVASAAMTIHGISRFKLTGGEPTVRPDLLPVVRRFAELGPRDLSLTTNGQLLEKLARPLKDAGLNRVTISLDSLRPGRFRAVTRTGDLAAVLRGLDATIAAFGTAKLNCVVMRGTNDDEVAEFAALTLDKPISVRFIEYMPLADAAVLRGGAADVSPDEIGPAGGCGAQDRGDVFVSETETRDRIEAVHGPLEPLDRAADTGVGPAKMHSLAGAAGKIGFISAMSAPFCDTCNRLRLTAAGVLRSCLFDGGEVDLRPLLRANATDADLANAMTRCVAMKPITHSRRGNEQMSRIGG